MPSVAKASQAGIIAEARKLVRNGQYVRALEKYCPDLERVAEPKESGGIEPWTLFLHGRSLAAEIKDQTGDYVGARAIVFGSARKVFGDLENRSWDCITVVAQSLYESLQNLQNPSLNLDLIRTICRQVFKTTLSPSSVRSLGDIFENTLNKHLCESGYSTIPATRLGSLFEREHNKVRHYFRAHVMFVTQGAVACHRERNHQTAIQMLRDCLPPINRLREAHLLLHGVQSSVHYWLGRMLMLQRDPVLRDEAADHFQRSIEITELNVRFHEKKVETQSVNREESDKKKDERLRYCLYNLASSMAFGLSEISQMRGSLDQALSLIRPAIVMLRLTSDNFRLGYATMLLGIVQRQQAGIEVERLKEAIENLDSSIQLFRNQRDSQSGMVQHIGHLAKAHHEAALGRLCLSQGLKNSNLPIYQREVMTALTHIEIARKHQERLGGYCNPFLNNDISRTECRIRLILGDLSAAAKSAIKAIEHARSLLNQRDHISTKICLASALIVHAEVNVAKADEDSLTSALRALGEANGLATGDETTLATIGLYWAKIKLRQHKVEESYAVFQREKRERATRIQNGWLQHLAGEVENELQLALPLVHPNQIVIDLEPLLNENSEVKFFKRAQNLFNSQVVEWARKDLTTGKLRSDTEVSHFFGITRQTISHHKKCPPAKKANKRS